MGVDSATPKGRLLTDYFIPLTPTKKKFWRDLTKKTSLRHRVLREEMII